MEIIFATGNRHKLSEAQNILGNSFILKTPADYGILEEIPETADTIEGNAIQKVQYIWDRTHKSCFADDTGLLVDYLGGAPGVYSARYAGESKSFSDNIAKLLYELEGVAAPRRARFLCVVALIIDGSLKVFQGICEGEITDHPSGDGGFGYDPIFRPSGYTQSFSELSSEEKNAISHRGKVMRLLSEYLNTITL